MNSGSVIGTALPLSLLYVAFRPLMATFPVRTSGSALVVMVEPAEYRNSLDAALHLRRSSDGLLPGHAHRDHAPRAAKSPKKCLRMSADTYRPRFSAVEAASESI